MSVPTPVAGDGIGRSRGQGFEMWIVSSPRTLGMFFSQIPITSTTTNTQQQQQPHHNQAHHPWHWQDINGAVDGHSRAVQQGTQKTPK